MRARIGVSAAVLAATITVAACSGDEDEPSSLPDATSAGSAVTPTDTGSTSPADPTAELEAEITEFFGDYIDASNASWTSREALQARRRMFVDSCGACLFGYDLALRAHEEGLRFKGKLGVVEDVNIDGIEGDVVRFSGFTSTPEAQLVTTNGDVVEHFPATDNLQVAYQAQRMASGEWVIVQSEVLG
jgi:hypothetical protein